MDSFIDNPDATDKIPTEVGDYWFYGYRYGKISCGHKTDKELVLCQVRKIANGTMLTGNGQFIEESEIEEAQFIPATLPELPKE